ncbi:hypothetical protein AQ611_11390 [Burkholderia singularis]|nr:hypothetical protein AQ611_11390 [Burkholderia sp. Bp7605]
MLERHISGLKVLHRHVLRTLVIEHREAVLSRIGIAGTTKNVWQSRATTRFTASNASAKNYA